MNVRCLVIDDEPLAQKVLLNYIQRSGNLTCAGTCSNAPEASRFLQQHEVDLLFLDIRMPEVDGITFLQGLRQKPYVIFTTAHRHYAFDGFEYGVVDFLLKPISFERFLVSIGKLEEKMHADKSGKAPEIIKETEEFIFLKSGVNRIKVYLSHIEYIEGLKDYVKVVTPSQQVVIKSSMGNILRELGAEKFIRVHKSYIVPVNRINKVTGKFIKLENKVIPIGRQFWKEIKQMTTPNGT